jgi:menaquinone-dependent protoporphyrinogen oxidase
MMDKKILVAYGSWAGSTAEVAGIVASALEEAGAPAEAVQANEVSKIDSYRAVVVGSAIHAGQLHGDVRTFMARHEAALGNLPVAYFVVCMSMKEDTEENRKQVDGYFDKLRETYPDIKPVSTGLFAGVIEFKKLSWIFRSMMKMMKAEEGDFRDPEAIRKWAVELVELFV